MCQNQVLVFSGQIFLSLISIDINTPLIDSTWHFQVGSTPVQQMASQVVSVPLTSHQLSPPSATYSHLSAFMGHPSAAQGHPGTFFFSPPVIFKCVVGSYV